MKRPVLLVGPACILAAALAGCGQKGPLYLPDQARDVVTRPAPPASTGAPDSPQSTAPEAPPDQDENEDKDKNGKPPR